MTKNSKQHPRRLIAAVLSLVLIFSLAPMMAFASTAANPDNVWARPQLEINVTSQEDGQFLPAQHWTSVQFWNGGTHLVDIRDVARAYLHHTRKILSRLR